MPCGGKVLAVVVALFLALVAQQLVAFTEQERALINSVCNQTEPAYQEYCTDCLKMWYRMPEVGTYHADLKGVGARSILCTHYATGMAAGMGQAETPPDGDPKKDNYIYCVQSIDAAAVHLQNANVSSENGLYADAANQVQLAFNITRDCYDRIYNLRGYNNIKATLGNARGFAGAAVGVLKQVH